MNEFLAYLKELQTALAADDAKLVSEVLAKHGAAPRYKTEAEMRSEFALCMFADLYTYYKCKDYKLYEAFRKALIALYGGHLDPFKQFGQQYSWRVAKVDWPFRAARLTEIIAHLEKAHGSQP